MGGNTYFLDCILDENTLWFIDLNYEVIYAVSEGEEYCRYQHFLPITDKKYFTTNKVNIYYVHLLKVGHFLYCFPATAHQIYVYDIHNAELSPIIDNTGDQYDYFDSDHLWRLENKIYALSNRSKTIHVIDMDKKAVIAHHELNEARGSDINLAGIDKNLFFVSLIGGNRTICYDTEFFSYKIITWQGLENGISVSLFAADKFWIADQAGYLYICDISDYKLIKKINVGKKIEYFCNLGKTVLAVTSPEYSICNSDAILFDAYEFDVLKDNYWNNNISDNDRFRIVYTDVSGKIGIIIDGEEKMIVFDAVSSVIAHVFSIIDNKRYDNALLVYRENGIRNYVLFETNRDDLKSFIG